MQKRYYGLPYMGSKRKIADKLVSFMLKENPNAKYFYDLFGGGGAISFEVLQRQQIDQVFYNELNTGITELLKDVLKNGVTEKYYQWISREKYFENYNGNDFIAGLCQCIWSFGGIQRSYIYGKNIMADKLLLHNIIVNGCEKSLEIICKKFNIKINNTVNSFFGETIYEKRIRIMSNIKSQNSRLQHLQLEHLQRLQHLQHLQHLERLQRLEHLQRLKITNKSYIDVNISTPINETIIYLDPPYEKTGQYREKLNHKELYNYITKSPYKIYLSSYQSELPCALEIEHRSTLGNNKAVTEKLFTNNNSDYKQ